MYAPVLEQGGEAIDEMARADLRHLHVVMHDAPRYAQNVFSAVPSYLHGYWYFDEVGTRNNSSIRLAQFRPTGMSDEFARGLHGRLFEKYVEGNLSKYPQEDGAFEPEEGALCLFTQTFDAAKYYRDFVSYPALIEATIAARGGRRLYIKPHPLQRVEELAQLMEYHAPGKGVEVVQASIHQLLARASTVITQTSAVAFEANLHKVPAVLAGQTDFHHNAVTITDPSEMGAALSACATRKFEYEKYLVWFLQHQLYEPFKAHQTRARLAEAFARKGYPMGPCIYPA